MKFEGFKKLLKPKYIIFFVIGIAAAVLAEQYIRDVDQNRPPGVMEDRLTEDAEQKNGAETEFHQPMNEAADRITKKKFGTYVEPGNSPVTPEVFRGYHTGIDYEILPGEENSDVPVFAICVGEILKKEQARGYGGMVVQKCKVEEQAMTVVYGHVDLKSMAKGIGDILEAGEQFVILGDGFSEETSNERKHLHLSVHKGDGIDTRGYVSSSSLLSGWLNFEDLTK